MHDSNGKILIVGVGNILLQDDSVGLHVTRKLLQLSLPHNVGVVDCDTDLMRLSAFLNNPRKIIIIDAVRAGNTPGSVYKFNFDDLLTMKTHI